MECVDNLTEQLFPVYPRTYVRTYVWCVEDVQVQSVYVRMCSDVVTMKWSTVTWWSLQRGGGHCIEVVVVIQGQWSLQRGGCSCIKIMIQFSATSPDSHTVRTYVCLSAFSAFYPLKFNCHLRAYLDHFPNFPYPCPYLACFCGILVYVLLWFGAECHYCGGHPSPYVLATRQYPPTSMR